MIPHTVIRKATYKDIDQILILEKQFKEEGFPKYFFVEYLERQKEDRLAFYVLTWDDIVVGYYIVMFRKNSGIARIYSICVDASLHGQGIGRTMLNHIEEICKSRNVNRVKLEVSEDNTAKFLYKKMGYTEKNITENYYINGSNAINMVKYLV
jgi:ribosomal protein S18 acetylase RimI-like enzyme